MNVFKELYQNRKLIWKLSKNDFRNKFAGAYFGIVWAFIQPMVTVAVYFVVFQLGLRVQPAATGYPYICWLVSGIIPWFFFSDALPSASNCLLEYSYLVKKVVFKISVLPIVKVISSLFVHLFFIVFAILIFALMGKLPPVLNVGMWATPILWDTTTIPNIPNWLNSLLKLNPLYYIVQGYRDSFMNGLWFFEHPWHTLYFWAFVLMAGLISSKVFKRLRVHFSDVL